MNKSSSCIRQGSWEWDNTRKGDRMKWGKAVLTAVGAAVLLAAFVGTASAGRLSTSGLGVNGTWTTVRFAGGIGTGECEVILNGAFHERSISKTRGTLSGFVTAANITRCARGGGTILRETLPWHVRYEGFAGTLPTITTIRASVVGLAFRIREPTFGIECLSRSTTEEPGTVNFNLNGSGVMTSASLGGTIRCGSFSGTISGTSSSITALTVTLI